MNTWMRWQQTQQHGSATNMITKAQFIYYDEQTGVIEVINPRATSLTYNAKMLQANGYTIIEAGLMGWGDFTHVVRGQDYNNRGFYLARIED
jgi:hypothetical protein